MPRAATLAAPARKKAATRNPRTARASAMRASTTPASPGRRSSLRRPALQVQFHQPVEVSEDGPVAARLPRDDVLNGLAHFLVVEQAVDLAIAEELLGVAAGLPGDSHERLKRKM